MNVANHRRLAITWPGESNSPANWIDKVRSRDFLELAVVFTPIMVALWTPNPVRSVAGCVALVLIVLTSLCSGQHTAALGIRLAGLRQSLWVVCVALAGAAIAVVIGWRMHTLHPLLRGLPAWWGFWAYMFWALLQQFILQDFFLLRLLRLLPSKKTAIATAALLFAVVHIPNPLLIVLTLLWGATACVLFLRYRNLYTLGLAHGLLGLCLAIAVPNPIHHQMRVGVGYFRWNAQEKPVHRSQINQIVSNKAWVMAEANSRRRSLHARP
jgi:Type II CAAX prenyl endopeptidase Rce1-like